MLTLGFGGWLWSLPAAVKVRAAQPISRQETDAMLAALKPPKRSRPVIAIIGLNEATETTDYLVPTGILRRADVADVHLLALEDASVKLYPALQVLPDATIAAFDAAYPEGADYVIVPAMSVDDDPTTLLWLNKQAESGAILIGVCAGAKVLAAAGLLKGKRATTHWYHLRKMLQWSPTTEYVADRRFVVDGTIVTTTGVTASMPAMLTLIEAVAGRKKAEAVAADLGVEHWDARHASGAFALTRPFAVSVLRNTLAFWRGEERGIRLEPGIDEVSLALSADAWSRTYRSKAVSFAETPTVLSANGIRLVSERNMSAWPAETMIPVFPERKPVLALQEDLQAIAERYGAAIARVVAMQLEYPSQSLLTASD